MQERNDKDESREGEVVAIRSPRLDALEKLYVRTYLHTLSHSEAHKAVTPDIKFPKRDNPFSRRENVQFHISLAMQQRAESLSISPELVLEKLYQEATREGAGSNHAARIQALTLLGKHLGMFQEKKDNEVYTFNIVNYSPPTLESLEQIKIEKKECEALDIPQSLNQIEIKEYK